MKDGSQQSKIYEKGIVMMRSKKTASQKAQSRKAKASAVTRTPKSERANRRTVHTNLMGAKISKTLRNALDTLINSPRGREILASALVAAASAAAAALTKSLDANEIKKARRAAADAGKQLTQDLSDSAASVVAGIVSDAARSLLPSSLIGKNEKHKSDIQGAVEASKAVFRGERAALKGGNRSAQPRSPQGIYSCRHLWLV